MKELEETRTMLRETIDVLKVISQNYEQQMSAMTSLIKASEERIDRTNQIVNSLADVVKGMKDAYIHHIDQTIQSRDQILEQNTKLMHRIADTERHLEDERKRYDRLMCSLLEMFESNKSSRGMEVNIQK